MAGLQSGSMPRALGDHSSRCVLPYPDFNIHPNITPKPCRCLQADHLAEIDTDALCGSAATLAAQPH